MSLCVKNTFIDVLEEAHSGDSRRRASSMPPAIGRGRHEVADDGAAKQLARLDAIMRGEEKVLHLAANGASGGGPDSPTTAVGHAGGPEVDGWALKVRPEAPPQGPVLDDGRCRRHAIECGEPTDQVESWPGHAWPHRRGTTEKWLGGTKLCRRHRCSSIPEPCELCACRGIAYRGSTKEGSENCGPEVRRGP